MLTERIILTDGRARNEMIAFLASMGLSYERDIEYSFCMMDGETFAACGSLSGNVIKCVAVAPEYQSQGLSACVISVLTREAAERGHTHLFIYTSVERLERFTGLGYYELVRYGGALVLDNRRDGLKRYIDTLKPMRAEGVSGAIVLNANPFTLGHRHLVETALQGCDHLHAFVVGEDRSEFSSKVREELVRRGTADLQRLTVHGGSPYVLSAATFPTYFLKADTDAAQVQAGLDLTLFATHIAPTLNITRRFAGEEPLSPTTNTYNLAMKALLPPAGITVTIIPRKELGGAPISASRVRALYAVRDFDGIRPLVPPTTLEYLMAH